MARAVNGSPWWNEVQLAVARRAAEAAVDAAVTCLMPDPAARLDRLLDAIEHFVRDPGDRQKFVAFRRRVTRDPAIRARARQLLSNRTMVKRLAVNWGIHQLLLAPSERRYAEQRHGERARFLDELSARWHEVADALERETHVTASERS